MISKDLALLNDVPEGAYIQEVVSGSPADTAGIQIGDIVTKIDGVRITKDVQLSGIIGKKKIGDTVSITLYREGNTEEVKAILASATEQ